MLPFLPSYQIMVSTRQMGSLRHLGANAFVSHLRPADASIPAKGGFKSDARLWKRSKVSKYAERLATLFRLQPERATDRYRRLPRTIGRIIPPVRIL
jgi:hypothetical protein